LDPTLKRPPDAPKWDGTTKTDDYGDFVGKIKALLIALAVNVNDCMGTGLPASIVQQFKVDINRITYLGHHTWPPGS